jgi:carbonic anhydrase
MRFSFRVFLAGASCHNVQTPSTFGSLHLLSLQDFPMEVRPLARREFVQATGIAAAAIAAGAAAPATAQDQTAQTQAAQPKPDDVLQSLLAGNQRFVEAKLEHPGRSPQDFQALAAGQAPPAVILGCADSRVPPEVIFDQGVGELFVVRGAGNMVGSGPILKGSIEFAVGVLGARLIMVLGHTACGACDSAIKFIDDRKSLPGSIEGLVDYIRPSVRAVAGQPGDKLANVTKANVLAGVKKLSELGPILPDLVKAGELKIVGAIYDLATGKVEMVS